MICSDLSKSGWTNRRFAFEIFEEAFQPCRRNRHQHVSGLLAEVLEGLDRSPRREGGSACTSSDPFSVDLSGDLPVEHVEQFIFARVPVQRRTRHWWHIHVQHGELAV